MTLRMTRRRGQATVELAVGSLLVVMVLLFGIFFAEYFTLRLKAQEATRYAAFEAAMAPKHEITTANVSSGRAWLPPAQSANLAESRATARYASLSRFGLVSARVVNVQAACEPDDGPNQPGLSLAGPNDPGLNYLRRVYGDVGNVRCAVRFRAGPLGPVQGWVTERDPNRIGPPLAAIPICGAGAPDEDSCNGRGLSVLGGDWSIEGPAGSARNGDVRFASESRDPSVMSEVDVANRPYAQLVRELYERGPARNQSDRPGSEMMRLLGIQDSDRLALNENQFHMSSIGIDDTGRVRQRRPDPASASNKYPTLGADLPSEYSSGTPLLGYDRDTSRVDPTTFHRCFLGLMGCEE